MLYFSFGIYILPVCINATFIRDGPFNIQGGAGIFPHDKLFFFSLLAQQVIFSRSKPQQVFYFFEEITH